MDQHPTPTRFETLVLQAPTVQHYLDDYVIRAGHHLGFGIDVTVSLRHRGHDRLVASSSPHASRCDFAEYEAGVGPCIAAMDHLAVVIVPDILDNTQWPAWRHAALDEGFRSTAAIPAHVTDGAEVAVHLYSHRADSWNRDIIVRADLYAQQIAHTVDLRLQVDRLTKIHDDAHAATQDRHLIDQAVGATMANNGCTAPEALTLLRGAALHRNINLRDVAEAVLQGLTGTDPRHSPRLN